MPQLNGAVIAERAAALRRKGCCGAEGAILRARKGRQHSVLVESDGQGRVGGFHARSHRGATAAGQLVDAVVNGHDGAALLAVARADERSERRSRAGSRGFAKGSPGPQLAFTGIVASVLTKRKLDDGRSTNWRRS